VDLRLQLILYYTSHLYNTRSFSSLYYFNYASSCTSHRIINKYLVVFMETKLRFESLNHLAMYYNSRDIQFHRMFLHLGNILQAMFFSSKMFPESWSFPKTSLHFESNFSIASTMVESLHFSTLTMEYSRKNFYYQQRPSFLFSPPLHSLFDFANNF
jgi:hypothetical protein